MVYSVEPRATKNYTGIVLTNLAKDITADDTVIEVNDGSGITSGVYLEIEGEEIYVKSITGNRMLVDRGRDSTPIAAHVSGSEVKSITSTDNSLVEEGDDFGFSGSIL